MAVFLILIPMAFLLGIAGLAALLWALNSGQYEDLEGQAARILKPDEDEA
ncbi:cytochrome oxidase maturation protein, cbb3-type [Asticcacaulis biprosthecium C19]|uniref:Cytochrome oxidase maturation protein, cbb3-type n=1 Tax=Asticcacaulis biprosthecium C19 TaxID=715226 RepID=F4QTG7_9CAUL|nr:cbb3-type cytochrome oxidase assembly protein CcoS [Asticcacaulis biprosthecium]EGF90037.1 cytochrome oxidase maturation protein, cbb3-type [Asticcacaulis biprosthecium C19]